MKLKFKKLHKDAVAPKIANHGDAGADLTAISVDYDVNNIITYGTGIAVEIPEGYVGLIFPRSSIYKKQLILSNSVGVIDCVPAGTLIKLPDGSDILVEDLYSSFEHGDTEIMSYNEDKKTFESDIINAMWIVKNRSLLEIEDDNGNTIKIPRTKEIYTNRGWVRACDLTNEDYVLKY